MHKLRPLSMIAVMLGMMSIFSAPALSQDMSNDADKFYKSKKATMQKVTFKNDGFVKSILTQLINFPLIYLFPACCFSFIMLTLSRDFK